MKAILALAIVLLLVPFVAVGGNSTLAKELVFQDLWATRQGDAREYVLTGGGWFRGLRSERCDQFVSDWLSKHPAATVRPISRMFMARRGIRKPEELVYIWIEDGDASLNVDMVRTGLLPGGAMLDMVDYRAWIDRLHDDPRLDPSIKARAEKERAEHPELPRPERLVTEDDYKGRVARVEAAEAEARREKLGVWSDSMKEEREAEGYP